MRTFPLSEVAEIAARVDSVFFDRVTLSAILFDREGEPINPAFADSTGMVDLYEEGGGEEKAQDSLYDLLSLINRITGKTFKGKEEKKWVKFYSRARTG